MSRIIYPPKRSHYLQALKILRKAKTLIAKPESWTKIEAARDAHGVPVDPRDKSAVSWCLYGALAAANPWKRASTAEVTAVLALDDSLPGSNSNCSIYNDEPRRTHKQILALFERAIKRLEKQCR